MGMQFERIYNMDEHEGISREWEHDRREHERMKHEWEVERQESRREWERERDKITEEWESEQEEHKRMKHEWEVERQESRREWERERDKITRDWESEQEEHERARREWQRGRQGHEAERQSWERERRERERERQGERPYWGPLELTSARCLTYNTREYTARLFDILPSGAWHTTCMSTSQEIHGRTVPSPTRCENHGPDGGVIGYWTVNWDEAVCRPHWNRFWDKGCLMRGFRRWEGQLYNFKPEDDQFEMCQSTPAVLPNGQHMDRADYCDDRRKWNSKEGMVGGWTVRDYRCT